MFCGLEQEAATQNEMQTEISKFELAVRDTICCINNIMEMELVNLPAATVLWLTM